MAQEQIKLQKQLRDNALEVNKYMEDLNAWTTDAMAEELAENMLIDNNIDKAPIRGTVKEGSPNKCNEVQQQQQGKNPQKKQKRVIGSDYSAWEKFDVEEACKEIDMVDGPQQQKPLDEEEIVRKKAIELRNKALVNKKKELGNKCIQQKDYKMAIQYYTEALKLDPENVILPANRAQAHLFLKEFREAWQDCDIAIKNDPTFVKAYWRRASAKMGLGDPSAAQMDLKKILNLDPQHKEARSMLSNLERSSRQELISKQLGNVNSRKVETPQLPKYPRIVQPIVKPPHLQSKRSLFSVYVKIKGEEKENKIRRVDSISSNRSWTNGGFSSNCTSVDPSPAPSVINSPVSPDLNELNLSDSFETMRVGSITIPEKPKTGVQFTSHWKQLKPYPTSAAQYLLQMKADDYLIFEDTMESSVLSDILDTLVWEFIPRKWDFTENLEGLTKVRRLKTLIMFLTEKDRANARKLISLCPKKELQDFCLANYNF